MTIANDLRRLGFKPDQIATATVNGKPLAEAEQKKCSDCLHVEACPNGTVRIVVPGPPPGKPRMTQRDKWKKRPAVVRYRDWCDRVRESVGALPPVESIVAVNWCAYFEPPASWSKKKRVSAIGELHRAKPDIDNLCKAVLDCLFKEDQAVADVRMTKIWDWNARLEIEIVTK